MPGVLPIEIAAALIAAIPSAATVYLARKLNALQDRRNLEDRRAAQATYQLALFHMRFEVFEAVQSYLSDFAMEGRPTVEAAIALRRHSRKALFLFPGEVQAFVADLAAQAFAYQHAYLLWEPLRAKAATGRPLTEEESRTKQACVADMRAVRDALAEAWESGRHLREFERFLALPESLG